MSSDDGKRRSRVVGETPEQKFGELVRRIRTANGRSQEQVAEAMRAQRFEKFTAMHVSRIERGTRPLRLNEAVALGRFLDIDLIGAFVTAVAGPAGETAAIAERVAYVRVVQLTEQVATAQEQRRALQRTIAALETELARAEQEWQEAVARMNQVTQNGGDEI